MNYADLALLQKQILSAIPLAMINTILELCMLLSACNRTVLSFKHIQIANFTDQLHELQGI